MIRVCMIRREESETSKRRWRGEIKLVHTDLARDTSRDDQ